jgi:two-component sensor histidine kinase
MNAEAAIDGRDRKASDGIEDRVRRARTMLAVQAWRCANPLFRDELSGVVRRIRASISQYEQRRSNGVLSLDATDYLEGLRRHLAAQTTHEGRRVHLAFSAATGALSNEGALILGLIVNEVLTDASDHAQSGQPCVVALRLGCGSSGFRLSVADRRSGRTPWAWPGSFGLTLARQLVRELAETFTSVPEGAGVQLHVRFSTNPYALPLRNVSPRDPLSRQHAHSVKATQEAFHELSPN